MTQYKVTAPCLVHVPVMTATGPALGTVYAGDVLPQNVPEEKVRFWLDGGMIASVGEAPIPEPEKAPEPGSGTAPKMPPENGPGSGKEAWAAYAVASGTLSREDAEGMSKTDLVRAVKGE